MYHQGTCQRIKSIEYHENGIVRRVEYHDPQPEPMPPIQAPAVDCENNPGQPKAVDPYFPPRAPYGMNTPMGQAISRRAGR